MSKALSFFQGRFGRIALLQMDRPLVHHAHRACHVLFKAGGGDTSFDVRGRYCPLTRSNAVVVNAWERHAYTHNCQTNEALILALYIDPTWLASIDRHLIVSGHAEFFPSPGVEISEKLQNRVQELSADMALLDEFDTEYMENAVFNLMVDVFDAFSDRKKLSSEYLASRNSDYRVRRAVNWLRARPGEALDINALSKVAGLSRAHLFERFKHVTGLTPAMFLNTLRMEAAHPMLMHYDRPLVEVGEELGFSAAANFTRFFRQHQGITPSEYRRVTRQVL